MDNSVPLIAFQIGDLHVATGFYDVAAVRGASDVDFSKVVLNQVM